MESWEQAWKINWKTSKNRAEADKSKAKIMLKICRVHDMTVKITPETYVKKAGLFSVRNF